MKIKQPIQLILFFVYIFLFVALPFILISMVENVFVFKIPFSTGLFFLAGLIFIPNLLRAFFDKDSVQNLALTFAGSLIVFIIIVFGLSSAKGIGIVEIIVPEGNASVLMDFRFILGLFFVSFVLKSAKLFIDYKIQKMN